MSLIAAKTRKPQASSSVSSSDKSQLNDNYVSIVSYPAFKTVFHKIHKVIDNTDQGSLEAINCNYCNSQGKHQKGTMKYDTNFFQIVPKTRSIINNEIVSQEDGTFGIMSLENSVSTVKLITVPLQEYFNTPNLTSVFTSGDITDILEDFTQRYIAKHSDKTSDVSALFETDLAEKENKPEKENNVNVNNNPLSCDKKTLTIPALKNTFKDEDIQFSYSKLHMSQESFNIAAELISSIRSFEKFDTVIVRLLRKIFRCMTVPCFGNQIKRQGLSECFEHYITTQIQEVDNCAIQKSSFLLLTDLSVLLKFIRKLFNGNKIIECIIRIIDSSIQRDIFNYKDVSLSEMITIIKDFSMAFNRNDTQQKKQTGLDKIDQIINLRYEINKGNGHIREYLGLLKHMTRNLSAKQQIFESLESGIHSKRFQNIEEQNDFYEFLKREKVVFLSFVLRHKFKLVFEGNFTQFIDRNLLNDVILGTPTRK